MRQSMTFIALFPTAAAAHSGDHAPNTVLQNLWHLATQPDHLVIAAVAVLALAAALYLRKGRAR